MKRVLPLIVLAAACHLILDPNAISQPSFEGDIAAGRYHSCAIRGGGVWCWGLNDGGQLGNGGNLLTSPVPVPVSGLPFGAQGVSARGRHTCAVVNGGAWCWGTNQYGELGDDSVEVRNAPVPVLGLGSGVLSVAAGFNHSCALMVDGGVWCWGRNDYGQLGDNSTVESHLPVWVLGLDSGAQSISVGDHHACVIASGALWCWGYNYEGEVGVDSGGASRVKTAVLAGGLSSGVQAVSAGGDHTCAIVDGVAWCWGLNDGGELGNDSRANTFTPVQVLDLPSGVTAISAGDHHTCAVVQGAVRCWGDNEFGQLGNDSTSASLRPVDVSGLTSVQTISAGTSHTCARGPGSLVCWGINDVGELGSNSGAESHTPVPVQGAW